MLLPGAGLHSSLGNIGQLSPATSTSRPAPGPGCAPHWHMSPAGGGVVAGQDTSLAGDDITRLLGAGTLASPAARASLRLSSRLDLHYREHRPGCTVPSPALATTRTPHAADIITYFQFSLRPHSVIGRIMASALTAVTQSQCPVFRVYSYSVFLSFVVPNGSWEVRTRLSQHDYDPDSTSNISHPNRYLVSYTL